MACKNEKCGCKSPKNSDERKVNIISTVWDPEEVPILEVVPLANMHTLPSFAYPGDSGMDIYAAEEVSLYFGRVAKVGTGVSFNIPDGYEIQVRSRSGLASKGIIVANSPGTVDSGYRGEVCVLLAKIINDGTPYKVWPGDRIAQLVFAKVQEVQVKFGHTLKETVRGDKGFGSTEAAADYVDGPSFPNKATKP